MAGRLSATIGDHTRKATGLALLSAKPTINASLTACQMITQTIGRRTNSPLRIQSPQFASRLHRWKCGTRQLQIPPYRRHRLPKNHAAGERLFYRQGPRLRHKTRPQLCRNQVRKVCRQIYQIVLNRTIWQDLQRHKSRHKNHGR